MSESLMLETSKEYILFINFRDFELYKNVSSFLAFFQICFPSVCKQVITEACTLYSERH